MQAGRARVKIEIGSTPAMRSRSRRKAILRGIQMFSPFHSKRLHRTRVEIALVGAFGALIILSLWIEAIIATQPVVGSAYIHNQNFDYAPAAPAVSHLLIAAISTVAALVLTGISVVLILRVHERTTKENALTAEGARIRKAESAARAAEQRLQDALDALSEAMAIYDSDDRLLLANEPMRRLFEQQPELMTPGSRFEHIMRGVAVSGRSADAIGREEEWVAARVRAHRDASGSFDHRLADGRYLMITDRRMRDGGIVTLRVDVTTLKEGETRLRRLKESLDRIQRVAGVGSVEEDLVTGGVVWSPEARELVGIDPHAAEQASELELRFVHPQDRDRVAAEIAGMNSSGSEMPALEYRIVGPDGAERVVYREGAIERDLTGRPIRRIVTFKDITKIKATELQLREAVEYLDRVQQIAGVGSVDVDLLTDQVAWSPGACRIFGIDSSAVEPTTPYIVNFIHPDDREKVLEAAARSRSLAVAAAPMEYRIIRPDGAIRIVYREYGLQANAAGHPIRRTMTFKDITEIKATEAQLRGAMEHLDRVQRVAGIGSTTEDLATGLFIWSPGACAIFGVNSAETAPTPEFMRRFYHPDDRAKIVAAAERARALGIAAPPLEYRIIRGDGAERVVYRENAIEYDAAGRAVRRIVTFKDITDLKVTEARLRDAIDDFNHAQRIAGIGTIEREIDGKWIKWSEGARAICGVASEEIEPTYEYFLSFVHPDDRRRRSEERR